MKKLLLIPIIFSLFSKMEAIHFEHAQDEERPQLVEFAILSNDIYQTRTAEEKIARKVFEITNSTVVIEVLKVEGEIMGFYTLVPSADKPTELTLGHLFVKAGYQRKGYGTALFRRAVFMAQSKGWNKLTWVSDPDAESFYLKMGAIIIDTCENLLNPGIDLPIFEYTITNILNNY